jgi:hypothetical protein
MNLAPFSTKGGQVRRQLVSYPCDVLTAEPVDLAQAWRATWAVQYEHGFATCSRHVDMRRAVIVRVDHDPHSIDSKNSWHKPL